MQKLRHEIYGRSPKATHSARSCAHNPCFRPAMAYCFFVPTQLWLSYSFAILRTAKFLYTFSTPHVDKCAGPMKWQHSHCSGSSISCTGAGMTSSDPIEMSYSVFGDSGPSTPVVMLHGFLGAKTNWKYYAKKIASDARCQVFTPDARNHGDSQHSKWSDYSTLTRDLEHFLRQHDLERSTIIGHSMGGRTGMMLATVKPDVVERLIVVDISPTSVPDFVLPALNKVFDVLQSFLSNVPPGTSLSKARELCRRLLPQNVPDIGLIDAILNTLTTGENGDLTWRLNVNMDYEELIKPVSLPGLYNGPTHFICGEKSAYVRPEDHPIIYKHFPSAVIHYVKGAGHVVNFEKPVEFQEILYKCLEIQ